MGAPIKSTSGLFLLSPAVLKAQVIEELDDYWAEMSRTVEEGDFGGYSRLYHPEAILVDSESVRSYPIERALVGWEQGFRNTREGGAKQASPSDLPSGRTMRQPRPRLGSSSIPSSQRTGRR